MTTAIDTEPEVTTLAPDDDGSTDQDLVAGYAGQPAPVTTPTPDATTTTETAATDLTETEPVVEDEPKYVQITEAQLTELQNASKEVGALKDALHRNVSGMGSKMGTFEAALKTIQEKTPAGSKLVVTKEHFKELGEQFPDLLDMTVTGLNRALDGVQGTAPIDVDAKMSERFKAEMPAIISTVKQETTVAVMDELVPGWLETVNSPAYRDWLKSQPQEYANKIDNSWKVSDVKGSIDKFNTFTATKSKPPVTPTTPTRPSRAAAAVTPRSAGSRGGASVSTEESEMLDAYKGR